MCGKSAMWTDWAPTSCYPLACLAYLARLAFPACCLRHTGHRCTAVSTFPSSGQCAQAWCKISPLFNSRSTEGGSMDSAAGSCNACGATGTALMKLSLGKDFFGRIYDRLSPSTDQSPKWYCEGCSMQKNLQRDFRDITAEIDKLAAGQIPQLSNPHEF